MAEPENKYARMMKIAKQQQVEPDAHQETPPPEEGPRLQAREDVPISARPVTEKKARGRPAGKRSNSEYKPTTIFMRKELQRQANRLLEDSNSKQDLSDVIDHLLSTWVKRHQKA